MALKLDKVDFHVSKKIILHNIILNEKMKIKENINTIYIKFNVHIAVVYIVCI